MGALEADITHACPVDVVASGTIVAVTLESALGTVGAHRTLLLAPGDTDEDAAALTAAQARWDGTEPKKPLHLHSFTHFRNGHVWKQISNLTQISKEENRDRHKCEASPS